MTMEIRLHKVVAILSVIVTFIFVQSSYAQKAKPDTRTADQKMADFRTWDRLDSGAISPESVRGANSPAIQEKARRVAAERATGEQRAAAERQRMADFLTFDRLQSGAISPYSVRGSNSQVIRAKAEEMIRQLHELNKQVVRIQPFGRFLPSYFDYRPLSQYGHQYDAWNLLDNAQTLGAMGLTTEEQVFSKMTSRGLPALISSRPTNPNDDGSIAVGKRFTLYHYIDMFGWYPAPVEVIEVSGKSFAVKTLPGHPLQGTVKHEVVKDANGNFWLHQHGTGVFNEPVNLQVDAYNYAPGMWIKMSGNAMNVLRRR